MDYEEFVKKGGRPTNYENVIMAENWRKVLQELSNEPLPFNDLVSKMNITSRKLIALLKKMEEKKLVGAFEVEDLVYIARLDKINDKKK